MAEALTTAAILDAAREEVRRLGEARTTLTEVARSLGVSHAALYRHFPSKAALLDALVEEAMADEEAMAAAYVVAEGPAGPRLEAMVLDLHRRKMARFVRDPALHDLYRRVVAERPEAVAGYAARMTALVARLLEQGVQRGEFAVGDIAEAAGVVRDAVTAFIHPAHAPALSRLGPEAERRLRAVVATLIRAFGA
jgi:AcrR family transcriptional regulator